MTPTRFLLKTAGAFFVGSLALALVAADVRLWILVAGLNLGVWLGIPIGGLYEAKKVQEDLFND